jgi:hypothetical protein
VHLKVAPFYPGARPTGDKSRWTILEHRAIMSQMIGRPLLPNESVHHVNGIRDDNRPENLELWVKSQPAGQRARDLVAWAKDIMRIYEQIFAPPETPCPTQNRISIMPAENP